MAIQSIILVSLLLSWSIAQETNPTETAPSAAPQASIAICSTLNCETYPTITALQEAIASSSTDILCMCPQTYTAEAGTCSGDTTIVIDQNIRLECAAAGSSDSVCHFGCVDSIFEVQEGATLQFLGNRKTIITGGLTQSRIFVAGNGTLSIYGVDFVG